MANDEKRTYTQDQVNAILRRALEQHKEAGDGLSHDELVETAKEVGIEPAALTAAIEADERERGRQELVQQWRARRKTAAIAMWTSWAIVNALVFAFNMIVGQHWFLYVMIPWAIGISIPTFRMLRNPTSLEIDRMQEHELKRAQRSQLRDRYRRRGEIVERLVDEGASLLLSKLDQRRDQRNDRLEGRPDRAALPPSASSSTTNEEEKERARAAAERDRSLDRDRNR